MDKKREIERIALDLLEHSYNEAKLKVRNAVNSGAIDTESWSETSNKMLLPKAIATAILIDASKQYDCLGTSFEKQMKKDIKNIGYFL